MPKAGALARAGSRRARHTWHDRSVRGHVSVSEKFSKLPRAEQLASGELGFEYDFSLHVKALGKGLFPQWVRGKGERE